MGGNEHPNQTLQDIHRAQDILEQRIYELRTNANRSTHSTFTICKLSAVVLALSIVGKSKVV